MRLFLGPNVEHQAQSDTRPRGSLRSLDALVGSLLLCFPPCVIFLYDGFVQSGGHAKMLVDFEHVTVALIEVARQTHSAEVELSARKALWEDCPCNSTKALKFR